MIDPIEKQPTVASSFSSSWRVMCHFCDFIRSDLLRVFHTKTLCNDFCVADTVRPRMQQHLLFVVAFGHIRLSRSKHVVIMEDLRFVLFDSCHVHTKQPLSTTKGECCGDQ